MYSGASGLLRHRTVSLFGCAALVRRGPQVTVARRSQRPRRPGRPGRRRKVSGKNEDARSAGCDSQVGRQVETWASAGPGGPGEPQALLGWGGDPPAGPLQTLTFLLFRRKQQFAHRLLLTRAENPHSRNFGETRVITSEPQSRLGHVGCRVLQADRHRMQPCPGSVSASPRPPKRPEPLTFSQVSPRCL